MALAALADDDRVYTEVPGSLVRVTGTKFTEPCKILTQVCNETIHIGIAIFQNQRRELFYRNHIIPQDVPAASSDFNSRTIIATVTHLGALFSTVVSYIVLSMTIMIGQ